MGAELLDWKSQKTEERIFGKEKLPEIVDDPTKKEVFSICGRMVGHYPACGWLRVACSFVKRQIDVEEWNQKVGTRVKELLSDILARLRNEDSVKGQ